MKLRAWMTACALAASLSCFGSFASGQITGKVSLDGEAEEPKEIDMGAVPQCAEQHADPVLEETVVVGENGELANVVASIKPAEGQELKGAVPKKPAVLDQEGCQYKPHVLAMMVDQEIRVKNSDAFLHNVHTLPVDNAAINKGQPNKDPGMKVPSMKVPEQFPVKCDVHPWMLCHWVVFDHPFFAVSGEDGTFSIPTAGLEDGTYTIQLWHEKFGTKEIEGVEVKDGKAEVEEFKWEPEAAAADPVELDNVRLASEVLVPAEGDGEACKSGGECCESLKAKKAQQVATAKAK